MKLYLVEYNGRVYYDMYDGMVVAAETPEEAATIATGQSDGYQNSWVVQELNIPEAAGVVLASFNAG